MTAAPKDGEGSAGPGLASTSAVPRREVAVLDPDFRLELPSFEGPLDLLLHLCQKHEIDIVELPVAFITEKYLAYIDVMRSLNLDVASEYLVMAATLVHIKSRLLLPPDPTEDDEADSDEPEIDPREALIRRLLEYQKYKEAGDAIASGSIVGRDVFLRGAVDESSRGAAPLSELSLFALLDALQDVLARARLDFAREVTADRISVNERMVQLTELLALREQVRFEDLFDDAVTVGDIVVTLLAILEMAKRRLARVYQPGYGEAIFVRAVEALGPEAGAATGAEPRTESKGDA